MTTSLTVIMILFILLIIAGLILMMIDIGMGTSQSIPSPKAQAQALPQNSTMEQSMRLSVDQTEEVRAMIDRGLNTLTYKTIGSDSPLWNDIQGLWNVSRNQAKQIDDLKARLVKIEPHDHQFKCTICGGTNCGQQDAKKSTKQSLGSDI